MSKPIKVPFHGAALYIVEHNGEPYTPLKPIVEGIGLDWRRQAAKMRSNQKRWGVAVIATPSRGGKQEAICIPLRKLAGWMANLQASRVKPELREKITTYQNECDDVLWKYWSEGTAKRLPPAQKKLPKARYHYPRSLLDQPRFVSPTEAKASLCVMMLADDQFISPLLALLNQLRAEGHEVTAPLEEATAMREGLRMADKALKNISLDALNARAWRKI